MKTIIVPIDFSEISINALFFAAELTKRANSRLIIINILHKNESEEESKNKLKAIVLDLKTSIGSDFNCESLVVYGDFIGTLKEIIESYQPQLIVMGTKGASGLKKILIGSNTVHVIAKTKVPVLVIPELAKFENFIMKGKNRIVFATDLFLLENEESLKILKEIAMLIIEPKINVLNVRPKHTVLYENTKSEREFLLSYFKPEVATERTTIFSDNVMDGINYYLNERQDSGLIAMITRDSEELFRKNYTREMASHTTLPLLVLHDS